MLCNQYLLRRKEDKKKQHKQLLATLTGGQIWHHCPCLMVSGSVHEITIRLPQMSCIMILSSTMSFLINGSF